MSQMLIFGLGYSAQVIAQNLRQAGWLVDGTGGAGNVDFADPAAVSAALGTASHVLSSVPPSAGSDPVLDSYGDILAKMSADKWLGYLSSTGVYGDTKGAWVDESAPTGSGRRTARADADARWLEMGAHVFRLPGIYGPGRSAFERIASGKAHRIDLAEQIFSRVHVADIASGVIAAMKGDAPPGAYNLSDDLPASQNAVIELACQLKGVQPPPVQSLEDAGLSDMAKGFYRENRRVANGKAKRLLGWKPEYPTYREGLGAIWADLNRSAAL